MKKSKTHPFDAKKLLSYIEKSIELIKKNESKKSAINSFNKIGIKIK